MLKKMILSLMIVAMAMCLFAGCASSANQEESAIAGELIDGSVQENTDDPSEEPQKVENAKKPSANGSDTNSGTTDSNVDNDADQSSGGDDKDTTPGGSDTTPDVEQGAASDEQPSASGSEDQSKKPDTNVTPAVVDPDAANSGWYKVASYNIKSMWYDTQTEQTGIDQKDKIAKILREIDADIVGLQEVDCNTSRTGYLDQTKWLAEQLGYEYYYFTKTVEKGDGDYGHAILSRFPILKLDEVEFKEQSGEYRKYTRAVLDVDGQEVAFFNVHSCIQTKLDNGVRDSTSGQMQFREVVSVLQNEKIPAVMTGDFNLPKETQFKLFDRAKVTSMNGGKDLRKLHNEISIDNIYVNNKMEYYVDGAGMSVFVGTETASDHNPLWSYFKFK